MTVLDTLTLALGVDPKGIDTGLAEAKQKIDAGAKSMAQGLMTPLKAALGAVAAGLSLGAITNQYLNQADAIGKMADSIGADIEELQAWGEAAARAGGSADAFNQTVRAMTTRVTEAAKGEGEASKILQQFGVSARDSSGKARDTFEVLRDLAGAMEGMDKQKAVGLAQKMGIDRGTIMLLQSGRAAVDDLIARQKELGVYTKEDAEIAAKANDAIADLGQALKAGAAIIMRFIVPAITWVADKMTSVVQFFKRHQPLVVAGLGAIAAIVTARMIPAMMKLAAANAKAFAPFMLLAAIITGIALVVDDFWTYLNGGESALEDLWKTFGEGPELLASFQKAWNTVKTTFLDVFSSAKQKVLDFFSYFDDVLPPLKALLEGVATIIKGLFSWDFKTLGKGISQAFSAAVEVITNIFSGLWSYITSSIGSISWDAIKTGAKAAWEAVKQFALGFFEGLPQDAQDKLKRLWEAIKNAFSWNEIKKSFEAVFNFIPSLDKIIDAIKDGFKKAWDWILENIPGAKLFFDTGKNVVEAAKSVDAGEGDSMADDAVMDMEEKMRASREAMRPAPTEGVSSQAAAAGTQTTNNNLTQTDSRTQIVNITANTDNPQALGSAAARALDKQPQWARQSASSIMQGGGGGGV